MIQNKTAAIVGITLISLATFWTIIIPILGVVAILALLENN